MKSALFVQDRNLEGNDYFCCDDAIVNKGNPDRATFFSKLANPRGVRIYKSTQLNMFMHIRSININTYLPNESRDVKNRLVPIMFYSKINRPSDAYNEFVKQMRLYGNMVDKNILVDIKKVLEKENIKRKSCVITAAVISIIVLLICLF